MFCLNDMQIGVPAIVIDLTRIDKHLSVINIDFFHLILM